jgi:ribosomal-protein-alanine N-acetyltransferase
MSVQINSERFRLRELTLDDVTDQYLGWLDDPDARQYIAAAARIDGLSALREYVRERLGRDDVLFLGIFDKNTDRHVGNIKYEPVNSKLGYAIMGVLIGERDYRGKGVTTEILQSTAEWLKRNRDIREIVLGVDSHNRGAIRAYEKAGFVLGPTPYIPNSSGGSVTMVRRL